MLAVLLLYRARETQLGRSKNNIKARYRLSVIVVFSQSGGGASRLVWVVRVCFVFDVEGSVVVEGECFLCCWLY